LDFGGLPVHQGALVGQDSLGPKAVVMAIMFGLKYQTYVYPPVIKRGNENPPFINVVPSYKPTISGVFLTATFDCRSYIITFSSWLNEHRPADQQITCSSFSFKDAKSHRKSYVIPRTLKTCD